MPRSAPVGAPAARWRANVVSFGNVGNFGNVTEERFPT
jgi:hypothetical protein